MNCRLSRKGRKKIKCTIFQRKLEIGTIASRAQCGKILILLSLEKYFVKTAYWYNFVLSQSISRKFCNKAQRE